MEDAEILLSLFFFKLWNLCSGRCYHLVPRNSEVGPHSFVVLRNTSPYLPWKDVLISHHPHDTGFSRKRLRNRELHLVFTLPAPGFQSGLPHNREWMWVLKSCLFCPNNTTWSGISTEEKPKHTKAEMWLVTARELRANNFSFGFVVNPHVQIHVRKPTYTLKNVYIFVLGCSEFPHSHIPK